MCNLYRMKASRDEVAAIFRAAADPALPVPAEAIYPKYPAYVVRQEEGARILDVMRWGFPPPPNARAPVTNVRNLSSPFWRSALSRPDRRCLIPGSSFCEWEGEKGAKIQRWFDVIGEPLFAFAGIWRPTEDGAVFAMLTCDPNPLVAPIHPKAMPVILDPADYDRWLSADVAEACSLATPFPSQLMNLS